MLSVSDKYDIVNKEISELMNLHIQRVWQNAHKFIRQLANVNRFFIILYRFNRE